MEETNFIGLWYSVNVNTLEGGMLIQKRKVKADEKYPKTRNCKEGMFNICPSTLLLGKQENHRFFD